jgi:hypothetical protein
VAAIESAEEIGGTGETESWNGEGSDNGAVGESPAATAEPRAATVEEEPTHSRRFYSSSIKLITFTKCLLIV